MPTTPFLEKIHATPLVFDGAMGTMLYGEGVFVNRCFDEVNLTAPEMVKRIHTAYVEAGADVIETNTYGANTPHLTGYGLADRLPDIIAAACKLAREAAGSDTYVAGSVGPCSSDVSLLTEDKRERAAAAYIEVVELLDQQGVDLLMLETFVDLDEALLAAESARSVSALPIFVSIVLDASGDTRQGTPVEEVVRRLDASPAVDGIGLNCGVGPAQLYDAIQRAIRLTTKPFIAMPNAGQPQEVEGRMLYLTTPEYFTEYAKRFIELGVSGVGGCCGSTPAHIRDMAKTIHPLAKATRQIEIVSYEPEPAGPPATPMENKSRLGGKLARGEKITSVEILPPRSCSLDSMIEKARLCYLAGIDAINIPDGPRASARISPMMASVAIQQRVGIEAVLHYCCRDRNLLGMQSDLMGAYSLGVANFLIITGDPPKVGDYPDVTGVFDVDAIGLTQMATNLNHGRDLGGNPVNPPSGILIGVGVNPCAIDPVREMDRFRAKIDAGAEYAITQPVFDADELLRFLDKVNDLPNPIPIVAGIWPLTSFKNAEFMNNEVPGVSVPDDILERMRACTTKEDGLKMGCEIARDIRARIEHAVCGFQASAPFGRVELALEVLR